MINVELPSKIKNRVIKSLKFIMILSGLKFSKIII